MSSYRLSVRVFLAAIWFFNSWLPVQATSNWQVASGDWSTPANWGTAEPTALDIAQISNNGIVAITQWSESCSTLNLNAGSVQMTNGSLTTTRTTINSNGTGMFVQSAGINTVKDYTYGLLLSATSNSSGTYILNGTGYLQTYCERIGDYGSGTFIQSAGTNLVNAGSQNTYGTLYLGTNASASGVYSLSGTGQLQAYKEFVGNNGTGYFNHATGTNTSTFLYIGYYDSGKGTYSLNDNGQLNITSDEYVGYYGTGTFNHSAGSNTISNTLYLGYYSSYAKGTYNLSGSGRLLASNEFIGSTGLGYFNHSAGTNVVTNSLYVFSKYNKTLKSSIYELSGTGQLIAGNEDIGGDGNTTSNSFNSDLPMAIFNQSGGSNTVLNALTLGRNAPTTYNLTGGTLTLKSIVGHNKPTFNFSGGTLQASSSFASELPMTLTGINGNANLDTAGNNITLSGILSGIGGLNKLGSGTLTLSALNSYNGSTSVKGGVLEITKGIDPLGTSLIDIQSGKTIFKTANITKNDLNITTTALATFEVLNGSHQVGAIFGKGITIIDAESKLNASSISQNTLTIGNGATVTIRPISGGPLSGNITAVPEPAIIGLLAMFVLTLFSKRLFNRKTDS